MLLIISVTHRRVFILNYIIFGNLLESATVKLYSSFQLSSILPNKLPTHNINEPAALNINRSDKFMQSAL